MPRKLLEAILPVPKQPGMVIEARLPLGTMVIKFGYKAEKSAIQTPGTNGATVQIRPILLCVGDPRATEHEIHRFQMVAGDEDIPDNARFVDLITLPDGVSIHLFEIGAPTPVTQLVSAAALPPTA